MKIQRDITQYIHLNNRVRGLSGKIFARGLSLYRPSVATTDRANEVIKIFITWFQFQVSKREQTIIFSVSLQARVSEKSVQ